MNDWAVNEKHLNDALSKIRQNWPLMLTTLTREERNEGGAAHPHAPTPAPVSVLSLRRQVDERLAALVRAVRSENDVESRPDAANIVAVVDWLRRWANWLSAQEWITEPKALPELTHLADRCEEVAHGYTVRRYKVGPCPEHGTSDQGERVACDGHLFALIRHDHDPKQSKLRCDTNTLHEWESADWADLQDKIQGGPQRRIREGHRLLATRVSILDAH